MRRVLSLYIGEVMNHEKVVMKFSIYGMILWLCIMLCIGLFGCDNEVTMPLSKTPSNAVVTGEWILYDENFRDTMRVTLNGNITAFTGVLYGYGVIGENLPIYGGYLDGYLKFQTDGKKPGLGCIMDYGKYLNGGMEGYLKIHMNYDYYVFTKYVYIRRK